jgi:hypothetical protein
MSALSLHPQVLKFFIPKLIKIYTKLWFYVKVCAWAEFEICETLEASSKTVFFAVVSSKNVLRSG